jgi:uncharacterized Fe-S cluster protein YjdI
VKVFVYSKSPDIGKDLVFWRVYQISPTCPSGIVQYVDEDEYEALAE